MKATILFCLILTQYASCGKILGIFPFASKSHHILGSALLKELAKRGHDVTMVSPYPLEKPVKNYKDVYLDKMVDHMQNALKVMTNPNISFIEKAYTNLPGTLKLAETILNSKELQDLLATKPKFDVMIHMWFFSEALFGISHATNATIIPFSCIGGNQILTYLTTNPAPPSYVPNLFSTFTDNMSFLQRVQNTLFNLLTDFCLHYINMPMQQKVLSKYFPEAPPIEDLMENIDLALVNSNIATETVRPYLPNIIQIGGFHLQEKQNIPDDVHKFLNESKQGVILFSLGSNVKSADLEKDKLEAILSTFRKIKYNVLWKFEADLVDKPKNVMVSKWLPQREVLGHPNMKAFITHGGLGGTVEAIYHGVPMLCMPFFGDQEKNVADSVANGYAIHLPVADITEETFTKSLLEIIENPKYRNTVALKSDLYKNQEINPMDKAVYWVEHVIKHKGAKHLKAASTKLPLYQYLLLDVIAFISFILITLLMITVFCIKCIYKLCCVKKNKVKVN